MLNTVTKITTSISDQLSVEALKAIDCGLMVVDRNDYIQVWNNWLEEATGVSAEEAIGQEFKTVFPGLHGTSLSQSIKVVCAQSPDVFDAAINGRYILPLKADGGPVYPVRIKPLQSEYSHVSCLVQVFEPMRDIPESENTVNCSLNASNDDAALSRERQRARAVLASVSDGVITVDAENQVEFMNLVAEQLTGYKFSEVKGQNLSDVFQVENQALSETRSLPGFDSDPGLLLVGALGTQIPIELSVTAIDGAKKDECGSVIVFRDLTHSRKMAAQLVWQANHDPLTGLENRTRFDQRLERLISSATTGDKQHALLYVDLDQFKIVNDTCGHAAGDELLRRLTNVLKYKVRNSDIIARLGGDEFGILLENCAIDHAMTLANELRVLVNEFRFTWEGKLFSVGLSIGLVPIDENSKDASTIMMAADAACYAAKEGGRNRVHLFEPETSVAAQRKGEMHWISRIHGALEYGGLQLYLQDIIPVDGKSKKPSHVEVLVRMKTDTDEMIPPGAFIPAAERYNLMPMVDRWVVTKAFSFLAELVAGQGAEISPLNINLSGASLVQEDFLGFVLAELERFQIPANLICFEITETAAIANLDDAVEFISTLKKVGCRFALDDFGSGLSSFGYLKHLPVDYLKIDGAFINDLEDNHIHRAMVDAINRLGHVMGIKTVAEFVETAETLEVLREIGVDYAQGYYISEPYPIREYAPVSSELTT